MNVPLPPDAVAVAQLPIAQITPSPSNPRKHFDDTYIAELAESIKAHGLIQPVTVRPNPTDTNGLWPYQLVVGECRWRAAKLAGLVEIPGFWRELDDKQVLEIQVVENLQRRDVHPIEEAEGYQALMSLHGYTADEIAAKIGKSRGYVYARLKLAALCPAARKEFFDGRLDASTALLIARIPGEALQKKALNKVLNGYNGEPLSYRTAVFEIRNNFTASLKLATFRPDDAELVPTAGSCTACPKRSGNAPALCADLKDEDVCTDTQCFDEKKLARRTQLIATAEKLKIPVLTGDEAWQTYRDELRIDFDAEVEGDGQERTYRQILGDKLPRPVALAEIGHGDRQRLVELADATAMEKALKKAGWQPDMFKAPPKPIDPDEQQRRDAEEAARLAANQARTQAAEAEQIWRNKLIPALFERIEVAPPDMTAALAMLATVMLHHQAEYYDIDDAWLERWGITLPNEYDGWQEAERIGAELATWPSGRLLAFLCDAHLDHVRNVHPYSFDPDKDRPHALLTMARAVDFAPETLRERSSTPTTAAQAPEDARPARPAVRYAHFADGNWITWSGKGKRPAWVQSWLAAGGALTDLETDAEPAPALPANEPPAAANPRTPAIWPFPEVAEAA